MPAPEEASTTKHTGERHSTAESTAPLRKVGELSHLKHSVGPPWSQGKTIILFYYAPHVEHFDFIVCHT